jgi:hypothetical protein
MAEDEIVRELFIVHWTRPRAGAADIVLCEYCGATRYSSAENIQAARDRKMHATCPDCYIHLVEKESVIVGGLIRHGTVVERKAGKN